MHFKEFFIWCIERNNYVLKRTLFYCIFFLFCALQSGEKKSKTRASAKRCTNTPGWHHYLIFQNNLQLTIGQDIRQNHWTTKYRSLTCIYFMRSIFVSYWSISPNMMFVHQISFKILSKIADTKYRSLTYIYFMRSILVSHWSIISSMTFIHQIVFKIWDKIKSLTHICLMRPTFVSHWSICPNIIFLHQTVFKILSKITGPWNIGQWAAYILWGQSLCHTDPLSKVWPSAIK